MIGELKSTIPYLNRKLQEAGGDLPNRAQHVGDYISFLYALRENDLGKHGISSRFTEVIECQKIIDKEEARAVASRALQRVIDSVEQFDEVWDEITTSRLPSCWDPTAPVVLVLLDQYTARLQMERDRTDLQMGKATQLKASTIVTVLKKEFNLLYMIRHRLPTEAGIHTLSEAFIKVEKLSAMPEPTLESQQRLTQFMSQHTSSSANVPPPESATASTQPRP